MDWYTFVFMAEDKEDKTVTFYCKGYDYAHRRANDWAYYNKYTDYYMVPKEQGAWNYSEEVQA